MFGLPEGSVWDTARDSSLKYVVCLNALIVIVLKFYFEQPENTEMTTCVFSSSAGRRIMFLAKC